MRRLHGEGQLSSEQDRILADTRPPEELYDLEKDPHESKNLATDAAHRKTLETVRRALERWITETNDKGSSPEDPAMYDSDMAVYMGGRHRGPAAETLRRNIELMKRWAKEGR